MVVLVWEGEGGIALGDGRDVRLLRLVGADVSEIDGVKQSRR